MAAQIIANGVISGCVLALVALAFGIVYGGLRILHIALGASYTAAAYFYQIARALVTQPGREPNAVQILTSISLALFGAVVLSLLIEATIYRPLYNRNAPPLVTFLASLGAYLVTVNMIGLLFGDETKMLSPFEMASPFHLGGLVLSQMQALQICLSLGLVASFFLLLHKTSLGRNIRALSDNPVLYGVFGYDMPRTRLMVFSLSALLAGSASLLKAADVGTNPQVGLSAVLSGAVAVMIGAVNSFWGVLAGALLLGIAQNAVIYYFSAEWSDAATFAVLIVVLAFRRDGLFAPTLRAEER
jgi:branched-chain amino acid transport system permease protein